MRRLIVAACSIAMMATLFAVQPAAAAEAFERPSEPRCFTPWVSTTARPVIEFENIDDYSRAGIRYEGKWVDTVRANEAAWTAPSADFLYYRDWEVVLHPGKKRITCRTPSSLAQIDLGPDDRACFYAGPNRNYIVIAGDYRGDRIIVRNGDGWLATLPDDNFGYLDDRLADSQAFLRIRTSGVKGFTDIACTDDPAPKIRFQRNFDGAPAVAPPGINLENEIFVAERVGETVIIENKRTGEIRTYQTAFDNQLKYISEDGRYLHWYREFDWDQHEAADLWKFEQIGAVTG